MLSGGFASNSDIFSVILPIKRADHGLYRAHGRRSNRQSFDSNSDKAMRLQRSPAHFATDGNIHFMFVAGHGRRGE